MTDDSMFILLKKEEQQKKLIEAECQNCGKKMMIFDPYYGCLFCDECMHGHSYETADASEFKPKYNWEGR